MRGFLLSAVVWFIDAKTQETMRDLSDYIANHFTRGRQKWFAFIKIYTTEMDAKPFYDCLLGAFLLGEVLRLDLFTVRKRDVINITADILCPYYNCDYPKSPQVKEGLKCLLRDRYRNDVTSFVDKFVHPTQSLLGALQEEQFPLFSNGKVVLHLVPPVPKLRLGEFFYQIGHTNPRTLVVKFAMYRDIGTSLTVNELQRSTVDEADYDIAFTKEYFNQIRSEAPRGLEEVLMRTLIVLSNPDWSVEREGAVKHLRTCPAERHGRLSSESHLFVQESCESITSGYSTDPPSPTENNDFSLLRDDVFRRINSSDQ